MADILSQDEVDRLEEELRDRFGPMPLQVQNLAYVVRLKIRAGMCGVGSITRAEERLVLRLDDETGGARQVLQRRLGKGVTVGNNQIRLELSQFRENWEERLMETLTTLGEFRQELEQGIAAAVAT